MRADTFLDMPLTRFLFSWTLGNLRWVLREAR